MRVGSEIFLEELLSLVNFYDCDMITTCFYYDCDMALI